MEIRKLLNLLDATTLSELGSIYEVDKVNNKITGEFILKSFLHCILLNKPISLRSIEQITKRHSSLNKLLKTEKSEAKKMDHSALSKRLKKINKDYFRGLYESIVSTYNTHYKTSKEASYHIFDSTILTLSGKLLKDGLNLGGKETDRHIKVTIGIKRMIPSSIRLCKTQSESSENIALLSAIREAKVEKEDILLFDRGISKTQTYLELGKKNLKFVTRINLNRRYKSIKNLPISAKSSLLTPSFVIVSDEIIKLHGANNELINQELRLLKCFDKDLGKEYYFLSNITDLSSLEITELYKKRWEIEVFFKFIKQHLKMKHFISHHTEGMMIYLYVVLIAAILFTIYKITNNLTGFKIALLDFTLSIEKELIRDLVIFCRGDPDRVDLVLL